ncbi:MAG TPA: hypothetical protein VLN44_01815 [Pyrinomonadaceae bacterium]|nr:hypothetical protein [Pyrinomonadaceae bacterium]
MEPKRSKYDTNPLDEEFADRATDSFAPDASGPQTEKVFGGPTLEINRSENDSVRAYSESEAPTRHIGDKVTSYPSVFVPPQPRPAATYQPPRIPSADIYQPPPVPPPAIYQSPALQAMAKPGSNTVSGLGIPERWAVILPYLPFWLAIVASVIELLLVPRTETRVRSHAAQGMALQIVITAISMLLMFAGIFSGRWTGSGLFKLASTIFLIIAMVRVWKGRSFVIPPLDEPSKWLDEKIKPRK